MTTAALRRGSGREPLIAAAALLAALVVGVAVARAPLLGLALVVAAVYVPLTLVDPPLGIALWLSLSFLSSLGSIGLALTGGTAVVLLAALGSLRRGERMRGAVVFLVPFGLMATWLAVSLAWSERPSLGADALLNWLATAAMAVAVLVTVRTARDVRLILAALVAGPLLSVVAGLANDGLEGASATVDTATSVGGRLVGGEGDPNFLAIAIVAAIVLAAVLRGSWPRARWLLGAAIAVLIVGLLATQSRGGLIAAAVTCVAAVIFMTGQRGKVLLLAATVVGVGVLYLSINPAPLDRVTGVKDEGNGRTELWSVGLRVAADHPLAGVGLGNFTVYSPRYADQAGPLRYADLIAERPHVVHNTYIEAATETGLVGLLLLLGAITTCVRAVWIAGRTFERRGEHELARLSRAVLLATIAVLTGAFFLSYSYRTGLWMFLALCVVLLMMALDGETAGAGRRGAVARR